MVRETFLSTEACGTYPELEKVRADTAAALRASVGTDLDDPRLTELVGELSLKSPEFRRLWARQDVRNKTTGRKLYNNPLVGELDARLRHAGDQRRGRAVAGRLQRRARQPRRAGAAAAGDS